MATLRRSPIFRMLLATAVGTIMLTTLAPGLALGLPLVAITRPTQGATVSGVIWIDVAFRSDSNRPITRLEVYIDDQLAREVDLATPLLEGRQSFNWDFSYAAATTHKIAARAIDSANAAAAASISVQVAGAAVSGPDRIPPVVRIYYPAQGAKLHGQVEVKAEATDNVGVEQVYFYIDGRLHKMMMNAPPYVDSWDTTREPDGNHVLEAVAFDAQENEARSAQVTVIVENANLTTMNKGGGMQEMGVGGGGQVSTPTPVGTPRPLDTETQGKATLPAPQPVLIPNPQVLPAPSINPVAPAPAPTLSTDTPPALAGTTSPEMLPVGPVFRNTPVTPTPMPVKASATGKVQDVDPLLSVGMPKVTVIVPQAADAGPVPGAPAVKELLPIGNPQTVTTARAEGLITAPAPMTTSHTTATTLPKPGTQTTAPTATATERTAAKTVAPTLQRELNPNLEGAKVTVAAPTPTWEAVPVVPSTSRATTIQRLPASAQSGLVATLAPAKVAAPELAPASRASVSVAKSSAPLSTINVTATARTSVPGVVDASAATPAKLATLPRPTLTSAVIKPAPAPSQKVTPVGPPVATSDKPIEMQPVTSVLPDHKSAPAGLARLDSVAPAKTTAPVTVKSTTPEKLASATHPAFPPAVLSQAALAEFRAMPVPASRMLAMLPPADQAKLKADGKITAPGKMAAAVPVAVAKVRDIKIVFDGEILSLRSTPETRMGISLAPLREIFEKTDGVLYWFPTEKKVQAVNKSVDVSLKIGDPKVTVNGQSETLVVAPYLKQGRTMVPLQFIADLLDVKIAFDNGTGQILISSNQF